MWTATNDLPVLPGEVGKHGGERGIGVGEPDGVPNGVRRTVSSSAAKLRTTLFVSPLWRQSAVYSGYRQRLRRADRAPRAVLGRRSFFLAAKRAGPFLLRSRLLPSSA